jgi:hypothetical protein
MMLVIATQDYENYGAHDWDGVGECPSYWKAKGGAEFKVTGISAAADLDEILDMVRPEIERNDVFFQTTIIGYTVEADDYLSSFERSQLEYDGEITYREPEISYLDLQSRYEDPREFMDRSADADAEHFGLTI